MAEIADVDDALRYWTALAALIPDTPLFPVEDFAEMVQYLTPVLIDGDGWEDLVNALDDAVGRVAGGARVGEGCRDRGVALRKAGRPLDALHEIHRAKLEWWTGDTLRCALLAMSFIAQLYRDLNLPLAAKQYALAVAATSGYTWLGGTTKSLTPKALRAKILCARHNSALSPLDAVAGDLFEAVREIDTVLGDHAPPAPSRIGSSTEATCSGGC
jgi:hypothetical protein